MTFNLLELRVRRGDVFLYFSDPGILSGGGHRTSHNRKISFPLLRSSPSLKRNALSSGAQPFVERNETVRYDPASPNHGHEIMIAVPPGHDMQVQMFRYPRARSCSYIPTDIKSLRLNDIFEQPLGIASQVKKLDFFAIGQLRKS